MTDINLTYWDSLLELSNTKGFAGQLPLYRKIADLEALIKIEDLVNKYLIDFPKKKQLNPYLQSSDYNYQCQSMVTGFLFQPPLIKAISQFQRNQIAESFKDWNPNNYCLIFYKKLREGLGL